jgi:hypothetical protein
MDDHQLNMIAKAVLARAPHWIRHDQIAKDAATQASGAKGTAVARTSTGLDVRALRWCGVRGCRRPVL